MEGLPWVHTRVFFYKVYHPFWGFLAAWITTSKDRPDRRGDLGRDASIRDLLTRVFLDEL